MEITLAMVMSLDGKTTDGNDSNIYSWTSPEDQAHFNSLKQSFPVIIMGGKTFEAIRDTLKLTSKTLRVVVTRVPEKYDNQAVPGQLEFTKLTPSELVKWLETRGYDKALLASGSNLNQAFLEAGKINELVVTIEPLLIGDGRNMFTNSIANVDLELLSSKKLNQRGTLLCHYKVL